MVYNYQSLTGYQNLMFLNAYLVFFGGKTEGGSDKVEISELTKSYIPRASIGAKKKTMLIAADQE